MGLARPTQETMTFPQWKGVKLEIVSTPDGVYFPFSMLCETCLTGLNEVGQRQRLYRDAILKELVDTFPLQTAGGEQKTLCLHMLGVGRFLNGVSLNHIREELRPRFLEFQWEVTIATYRIFTEHFSADSNVTRLPTRAHLPHVHEKDIRGFLLFLADRLAVVEQDNRLMRESFHELANELADTGKHIHKCPNCGFEFEDE